MALIGIFPFYAVGGYLYYFQLRVLRFRFHAHRAKTIFIHAFRKEFLDLFRPRVRRHVPILRLAADEHVPHATAHQICLKPRLREGFCRDHHFSRNGGLLHCLITIKLIKTFCKEIKK